MDLKDLEPGKYLLHSVTTKLIIREDGAMVLETSGMIANGPHVGQVINYQVTAGHQHLIYEEDHSHS